MWGSWNMERLTYKSPMGDYGNNKEFEDEWEEKAAYRNALGKYEDLCMSPEDIKPYLPKFPIGSTVYQIYGDRVFALIVKGFQIEASCRKYKLFLNYNENNFSIWVNDWIDEKLIFKTKIEAEQAIKLEDIYNESKK